MKMASDWKLLSVYKQKHLVAQLLVATLFVGLSFRIVFFRSSGFDPTTAGSDVSEEPPLDLEVGSVGVAGGEDRTAEQLVSVDVHEMDGRIRRPFGPSVRDRVGEGENETNNEGTCDLFVGEWVPDQRGPMYTNDTCKLIEGDQNCMRNGRPDTGYLYWRWNPRKCELPRFDPRRFLDLMRNKTWALVGDSISRNHVQSLLCILSTVEQAVEIYYGNAYKSKKWTFPSHNFTISVIWSPFLTEAAIFEDDNGVSSATIQLHLDRLDPSWAHPFPSFDLILISSGKWFLKQAIYHQHGAVLGCHACLPHHNLSELGFSFAYRHSLRTALTFISTTLTSGTVLFRTSTPDHFEGGEWHDGGSCRRRAPAREGEVELKDLHHYLRDVELEEFENAKVVAEERGVDLRLLDLMKMSLLRPDGHPGPYRRFQPFAPGKDTTAPNDCLHWCLPGPIDAWNDVIMEMVVNG